MTIPSKWNFNFSNHPLNFQLTLAETIIWALTLLFVFKRYSVSLYPIYFSFCFQMQNCIIPALLYFIRSCHSYLNNSIKLSYTHLCCHGDVCRMQPYSLLASPPQPSVNTLHQLCTRYFLKKRTLFLKTGLWILGKPYMYQNVQSTTFIKCPHYVCNPPLNAKCICMKKRGTHHWSHASYVSDDRQRVLPGRCICLINHHAHWVSLMRCRFCVY